MKNKLRVGLLVCVSILLIVPIYLVSCSDNNDNVSVTSVPRFEKGDCQYQLASGTTTECGYLIVPEDRSDPNSKTIKIHVAILKDPDHTSSTGPLIFLTGGPGTSTKSAFDVFENPYDVAALDVYRETFGDDRDLIIVDQRGTNESLPSLYCSDELGGLRAQAYGMSYRDAADLRVQTLASCYNDLEADGIDLNGYDTYENAADIKDLRDVLGYDKVNIFGASYGTRLSMIIMKKYPEILRSVVIDSILPPEVNPLESQPEGTMYALETFFNACADQYPDTKTEFYAIIDRLKTNPVTAQGHHYDSSGNAADSYDVTVTGVKFVAYVVSAIRATPYMSSLPKLIKNMYDNQTYQEVADSWIGIVDFFFTNGGPGSYDPAVGMFESINASSDGYYTSEAKILSNISYYMPNDTIATWAQTEFLYWYPSTQGKWNVEPINPDYQYPVISDIPTLMLVGTLDAGTPSIFSEPSSRYLSHSFYFKILAGHATAYLPCVAQMIDDFVVDPNTKPVDGCDATYTWD